MKPRKGPLIVLVVFVLALTVGLCMLAGSLIEAMYGLQITHDDIWFPPGILGYVCGAVGGVLATAIWCRIMIPRGLRAADRGGKGTVLWGILWGVVLGVGVTVAMHLFIASCYEKVDSLTVVMCTIIFGVPSGALNGLFCGIACSLTTGSASRPAAKQIEQGVINDESFPG